MLIMFANGYRSCYRLGCDTLFRQLSNNPIFKSINNSLKSNYKECIHTQNCNGYVDLYDCGIGGGGAVKMNLERINHKENLLKQGIQSCKTDDDELNKYSLDSFDIKRNAFFSNIVQHKEYDILENNYIKEFDIGGVLYKHKKSGAKVLSFTIDKAEKEKTFMACFRTPILDATGVAHILEHSVLSGSLNYPLKDPFAAMERGSFYTFLNAFTYDDMTCYPISSTINKDFYNMSDVIIDSVLHPLCIKNKMAFQTEGWHYEILQKNKNNQNLNNSERKVDDEEELIVNGVVYNEMKGTYSSPISKIRRKVHATLFPTSYPYDSGGDPAEIPKLTYERYKKYYENFYHPSNAIFCFWGSDDVTDRLNFIDKHLRVFDERVSSVKSSVKIQPAFKEPKVKRMKYGASGENLKDLVMLSWVLNPQVLAENIDHSNCNHDENDKSFRLSLTDTVGLSFLDYLLRGNSQSLLQKGLIESGYCTATFIDGFDASDKHFTYSIGLDGVKQEKDIETKIESLILSILNTCADVGFTKEQIESAINSCEFALKTSMDGDNNPGVWLTARAVKSYFLGGDLFESFMFEEAAQQIKQKIQDGEPYFQNLIRRYFLNNPHRVLFRLEADVNAQEEELNREKEYLREIKKKMTEKEILQIKENTAALKEYQKRRDPPEIVSMIPILTLNDIEKKQEHLLPVRNVVNGVEVLQYELPSAGITYATISFNTSILDVEEMKLLEFLCRMITESGTHNLNEEQLALAVDRDTGGIDYVTLKHAHSDENKSFFTVPNSTVAKSFFWLMGRCLKEKSHSMLPLMSDMLLETNLSNKKRAIEMLKEIIAKRESNILKRGQFYTEKRISASLTSVGYIEETTRGISSYYFYKNLLKEAEESWDIVEKKLQNIRQKLINKQLMTISVTGDKNCLKMFLKDNHLFKFIDAFPDKQKLNLINGNALWAENIKNDKLILPPLSEIFAVPTLVNHVGLGGRFYEGGQRATGQDMVVSESISAGYLWDAIRSVGGAYGVNFALDRSGNFIFWSYLDPNIYYTLDAFRKTGNAIKEIFLKMTDDDITRAIIKTIRTIDKPGKIEQNGSDALLRHLMNVTYEQRQKCRDEMLQTTKDDFLSFADRLSAKLASKSDLSISVVASKNSADLVKIVQNSGNLQDDFKKLNDPQVAVNEEKENYNFVIHEF